jgi:FkbM family methyltransferase
MTKFTKTMRSGLSTIRTAFNYLYFRWHTRHAPPSGFYLQIHQALNYSRAGIRFMEDAAKAPPGEGVYAAAGLLLECPVNRNNVILDVGGFIGDWASQMRSRYGAVIHVFEPNPHLIEVLRKTFATDPGVTVHPFGLAGANGTLRMSLAGMGSSVYSDSPTNRTAPEHRDVSLRDVTEIFDELSLTEVALLKVNIEGGEYDFLERLIASGLHKRCHYIRVQFHDWFPNARRLRKQIVTELARTHDVEWSYPFVWESWRRKATAAPVVREVPTPSELRLPVVGDRESLVSRSR